MNENSSLQEIESAVAIVLEAERTHGIRTYVAGDEWAAVLALRSSSLAEYVCASNLGVAANKRAYAARLIEEAERRSPSGRRSRTVAESRVLLDRAARKGEEAVAAEASALSVIGVTDLGSAYIAVSHLVNGPTGGWLSTEEDRDVAEIVVKSLRRRRDKRRRWSTVSGRASQSRGALLPLSLFDRYEIGDEVLLRDLESGPASTIGSAVELLVRWELSKDARAQGDPSDAALEAIRGVRRGEHTESGAGLIAAGERSQSWNDDVDEEGWRDPEDETLIHIAEMRSRVITCFDHLGRPMQPGAWIVSSPRFHLDAHIDFVTADTVWDLKVSDKPPQASDVRQLLLYWLVFLDDPDNTLKATYVGICNPRLGVAWRIEVADIPEGIVAAVQAIALSERP